MSCVHAHIWLMSGWKLWAHRRTAVRQDFLWWSPSVPWVHFGKAPFPLVRSSSWIQKPWQCLALTKRQVCMNVMESVWEMRTAHFPWDLRFDFVSDIEPQADMIPAKHAHQCYAVFLSNGPARREANCIFTTGKAPCGGEGQLFVILSSQPDFVQGRCCSPKDYDQLLDWTRQYLQWFDPQEIACLLDFQGDMPGFSGDLLISTCPLPCSSRKTRKMLMQILFTSVHIGFLIDLGCRENIGLIKSVLEQDSRLKLCWDFQEVLQGLIYQAHPSEFNACLKNVIDVQNPFSRTENHLASLSSKMKEVASVQKDPTCRAELAAPKMDPPDWDKYHACSERAFRRPFSRHFLEYGASNVLAVEAIIFPLRATCSFDETSGEWQVRHWNLGVIEKRSSDAMPWV